MFADFRTDAVVEGVADEAVRLEKTRSKHHLERQGSICVCFELHSCCFKQHVVLLCGLKK